MEYEHSHDDLRGAAPGSGIRPMKAFGTEAGEHDPYRESSCPIERLVAFHLGQGRPPMQASEVLARAWESFQPLFGRPPLGPIPDYLQSHWRVFGCVAEYEKGLEQIDRWKEEQLDRWLQERVGRRWRVDGRLFELIVDAETGPDAPAYSVRSLAG